MTIKIYKDEFPLDVWEEYCNILGESSNCYMIEMWVSKSEGYYEEEEDDDDLSEI